MKKLLAAVSFGIFAISGQATLTTSTAGGVTTLTDNFNSDRSQCSYMSLVNASCLAASQSFPDGYLQMAPGIMYTSSSASFSYNFGQLPTDVSVSFWYSTALNHTGLLELAGQTLVLASTGYNSQNPGANNPSSEQAFFSYTFHNVSAGTHNLTFATSYGTMRGLKVDDLSIAITPVPEPEGFDMLLAGLGLVGAITRRRNAKQAQ